MLRSFQIPDDLYEELKKYAERNHITSINQALILIVQSALRKK